MSPYKQVYYQLTVPIFELQKYSYLFWLLSVVMLREQNNIERHSRIYTAFLYGLSIVNGKNIKLILLSIYY